MAKSKDSSSIMFQSAFTLIELLVVISIIGMLASMILVSFQGIRETARDTVRVESIRRLRLAMDMYHIDHGSYPSTGMVWTSSCATPPDLNYIPGLVPNYVGILPLDPSNCRPAKYTAEIMGYSYLSDGNNYVLAIHPETQKAQFKEFWGCDTVNNLPTHFMLTNNVAWACP